MPLPYHLYFAAMLGVNQPVGDVLVSLKVPKFLCKSIVYYIYLAWSSKYRKLVGFGDI
jgi:hypothetical protein